MMITTQLQHTRCIVECTVHTIHTRYDLMLVIPRYIGISSQPYIRGRTRCIANSVCICCTWISFVWFGICLIHNLHPERFLPTARILNGLILYR